MLKLTRYSNTSDIYVFVPHIVCVTQETNCTRIILVGGDVLVNERADEIMAMNAMLGHLHPSMSITGASAGGAR